MGEAAQVTENTQESPHTPTSPIEAAASRPTDDKHSVVLVADPEEAVRDSLAGLLTNWGYEVVCAANGWEALQILTAEGGPGLAILDWTMPGLDGPEVCRRVRAQKNLHYVFMILATVRGQIRDLMTGLGAGADDHLTKPFDPLEVRARLDAGSRILVQKALRESEERFHSAFECAGVGMALVHESGRWLQVNQTLCEFLGYTQQELQATTLQAITHADDLAKARFSLQQMAGGNLKKYQTEKRYLHKSGHPVWASLTVSPVKDASGKPTCLLAQIQDISKRKVIEEALRRSEALFRAIAENAGDIIVVLNPHDAEIRYASRATAGVLGYLPAELEGHCAFDFVHPDDRSRAAEALRYTAETGESRVTEVRVGHKSGTWRTLDSHAGAIRNDRGEVDGVVVVLRVIEDRIRAQQALREREEQLQLLLDSTAEAIFGLDLEGKCTFCNRACLQALGFEHATDLLGRHVHQAMHHSRADGTPYPTEQCRICCALRRGECAHADDEVVWRADGTCIPVEYWSYPVWREGKVVGCVITFVDITARKLAEDELRSAHAESELFINTVPSILIGTDAGGCITRWNRTAAVTFGVTEAEVRGKALADCGIRWLDPGMQTLCEDWWQGEGSRKVENIPFEKDGGRHFLGANLERVKFPNEASVGWLITGVDTTERKQLEIQLRQAQKLEAIGQLAAGIAHEINTPTQYVSDNTRFLKESWAAVQELLALARQMHAESAAGVTPEATIAELHRRIETADLDYLLGEVPRAIEQSLEGLQRVSRIVRAMKEFSHPGSEEKRAVDINKAIETTITVARNEWKYVAEMETRFDENLPLVPCHAGEFNQVILNLIINAAHAIAQVVGDGSQGKGKIVISTRQGQEWVEIALQDNGEGIPEEIRSRIFEPFFTTKPVGRGTGQGLALAHAVVVRRHNGRIWFETEVGKGTTFFIRLPRAAATSE
jgi:PAS domain S-box-containing protein